MKDLDFLRNINDVDADLLAEAEVSGQPEKKKGQVLQPKKHSFGKKGRAILAACLAAAILLAGIPLGYLIAKRNAPELNSDAIVFSGGAYTTDAADVPDALKTLKVTADGAEGHTLAATGSLVLTAAAPTDVETLSEYVKISPSLPMSVTQNSDTEFVLTPASGTFQPGTVYRVTVGDEDNPAASYAFQVETELCIKSVLPADLSLYVPVNTGIEVTFTDAVTGTDFSDFFTVSPKTEGKYHLYPDGRTVAFVPEYNLEYDTVYTVTVKEGIASVAGKKLTEGRAAKFRTMSKDYEEKQKANQSRLVENSYKYFHISVGSYSDNIFSPGETLQLSPDIWCRNVGNLTAVLGEVYRFPSADAAAELLMKVDANIGDYADGSVTYPTEGLTRIGEFSADPNDVEVPFDLPYGTYLIELRAESKTDPFVISSGVAVEVPVEHYYSNTVGLIVQISDLRPYTVTTDGQLLLWVNRVGTGAAEAECTAVTYQRAVGWSAENPVLQTVSMKTDANGICILEAGDATAAILKIQSGNDVCIIAAPLAAEASDEAYYTFLYTDRERYFSTDTVHFFGMIRYRYTGEVPEKIYFCPRSTTRMQEIMVNPDGTFEGEFAVEQMQTSSFYLPFYSEDGSLLFSKRIYVTEEEKPVYKAAMELDKLYYRAGETATATLTVTFFDGTPARGLEFLLNTGRFGEHFRETRITDENGQIRVSFITTYGREQYDTTSPVEVSCTASLQGFETQELNAVAWAWLYTSEMVFDVSRDNQNVYVSLYHREYPEEYPGNHEMLAESAMCGAPGEGEITYILTKTETYTVRETQYNELTKRTTHTETVKTSRTDVSSGSVSFENGRVVLPTLEPEGAGIFYFYRIKYADSNNVLVCDRNISAMRNDTAEAYGKPQLSGTLDMPRTVFGFGDSVCASYLYGGADSTALFVTVGDGIHNYAVCTAYADTYDEALMPGATVYGIHFDAASGKYSYGKKSISYNASEAAFMPLTVTADREIYRPGDTATVRIRAEGGAGGKVLLSIVDEADFALAAQNVNIFSFLSSDAGRYVGLNLRLDILTEAYYSKTSGVDMGYSDGAYDLEDAVRSDFEDNPVFRTVTLDQNGEGSLIFTVPDNITSWRITAIAAANLDGKNAEIRLGQCVSDVVCTLPFFLNLNVCDTCIVGDTLSVCARAYGVAANGTVSYTAVLTDENGAKIAETAAEADSKERAWLTFDPQPEGEYTVTVYGTCGEERDALETHIRVIPTAVAADVTRTVSVAEIHSIAPKYYPVTLTFSNPSPTEALYWSVASRLKQNSLSLADYMVARYVAFGVGSTDPEDIEEACSQLEEELRSYGSCRISQMPYSEDDTELTALILSVAPEVLSENRKIKLTKYLYQVLASQNQTDDVTLCASLASLAALGEPVLDRLYAVATVANRYSPAAKLYLALAFACIGDYGAAKDIYTQMKAAMGTEDTEYGTLYFRGDTTREGADLTALALCIASRVARADAAKLVTYLNAVRVLTPAENMALASYLRYFRITGKQEDQSFTYTLDGIQYTKTLRAGVSCSFRLNKAQLEAFSVEAADAGISVTASYYGNPAEMLEEGEDTGRVQIRKDIQQIAGDLYRVTLTVSGTSVRVSEGFDLNDTLPAGATLVSLDRQVLPDTYHISIGKAKVPETVQCYGALSDRGQTVKGRICVYNYAESAVLNANGVCAEYPFEVTVSYIIRGAVEGTFSAEPAFVRNYATGIFSVSEGYTATIRENAAWEIVKK